MLTEIKHFQNEKDEIIVTIQDSLKTDLRWKMSVNGKESDWNSNFKQILVHEGYILHTDFYSGQFGVDEFHPIRIIPAVNIVESEKTVHAKV